MRTENTHRAMRMLTPLLLVIVLAVMGVDGARMFGLHTALQIVAAFTAALCVPEVLYRAGGRTHPVGHLALTLAWMVMCASAMHNLGLWTAAPHASLAHPVMGGDAQRYYDLARYYYDGSVTAAPPVAFPGLTVVTLWLWRLLGMSVLWPVAMNMMFTLTAIVIVGFTTCRLLSRRVQASPAVLAATAMCLTSTLMFYLSQGVLVLKEAGVYVSMASVAWVFAGMNEQRALSRGVYVRDAVIFAVAVLMMGFFRTTYLYFVMMGVVMMGIVNLRHWWLGVGLMVICLGAFWLGNLVASYSVGFHMQMVAGGDLMQWEFMTNAPRQAYLDFIGYYFYYSHPHRLALLPLTASVQYIIPFPWLYSWNLADLFPRLAWGWYFVGGIALFYYAMISWHRGDSLGMWPWWIAASFGVIAYVIAGSVSRYVLPLEQLFVPVAVYVLCLLRQGTYKKPMLRWSIGYVIVLAVTLAVCYHIQASYLDALSDYYHAASASAVQ